MEREQIFINPFKGPSAILFIKACTIWSIYPEIILLTSFATLLVLLDQYVPSLSLRLSPTILTVLGTVIGFVLSYRTSSAYERYTEGRKQWSNVAHVARTLALLIWSNCRYVVRLPTDNRPATESELLKGIIEKKSFMNLIEGFAVSLKHYLRGEHGIYYEDLYHLACFLPKYNFPNGNPTARPDLKLKDDVGQNSRSSLQQDKPHKDSGSSHSSIIIEPAPSRQDQGPAPLSPFPPPCKLLPQYNPPHESSLPFGIFKSLWKGTRNATGLRSKRANYSRRIHDDNIPLEILCCMSGYVSTLQLRKVLDVPTTNMLLGSISSLSDSLTTLERILTTPIPFGYIVHLKLIIWVYLICLPFQLISTFGYVTIPAVALISIAFLGFLQIGEEIENPFGYDSNDLDMDHFCHNIIARELAEITALPPPDPDDFIFTSFNMPLLRHGDQRDATKLAESYSSPDNIQRILRTQQSSVAAHLYSKKSN